MLTQLLDDLEAEQSLLDLMIADIEPMDWDAPTPAEGWTVRDQISHLAFSEELASLAATDPAEFEARLADLLSDLDRAEAEQTVKGRAMESGELLAWWRQARATTVAALRGRDDKDRVPWVTGEMSAASFATARLMETWAHGQDVIDALDFRRPPSARLRHIAHLGVATRAFSYQLRGLPVPNADVRVELAAPGGDTWSWGPEDASERISGPAEDFCLVVTQRRNVADTALRMSGDDAAEWLSIAQAFAGPPGRGRAAKARIA